VAINLRWIPWLRYRKASVFVAPATEESKVPEVEWIKITTDMFDNKKIRIIESMPDSDAILIIWIKLLTLAGKINASGFIFIREDIPYSVEELATVIDRPLNTVRLALGVFEKYGMIHMNGSHFVVSNWEKYQNVEGLARIRELTRLRVANYRGRQKLLKQGNVSVTLRNATEGEGRGAGGGEGSQPPSLEEDKKRQDKEIKKEKIKLKDIDEDTTLIGAASIRRIRRILAGQEGALEANKKLYRRELAKLGWLEEIEADIVALQEKEKGGNVTEGGE